MFSKLAILLASSSVALALPSRIEVRDTCSSGDIHCCDSIQVSINRRVNLSPRSYTCGGLLQPSSSTNSASLGGLIPFNLQELNIPIGINWYS